MASRFESECPGATLEKHIKLGRCLLGSHLDTHSPTKCSPRRFRQDLFRPFWRELPRSNGLLCQICLDLTLLSARSASIDGHFAGETRRWSSGRANTGNRQHTQTLTCIGLVRQPVGNHNLDTVLTCFFLDWRLVGGAVEEQVPGRGGAGGPGGSCRGICPVSASSCYAGGAGRAGRCLHRAGASAPFP